MLALILAAADAATARPHAPKRDHNKGYWCKPLECGKEFCKGGKADPQKFAARVERDTKKGLTVSEKGMVDAGVAIVPELKKLGCDADAKDPARGALGCGVFFSKHKEDRFIVPGVAPGLAAAATAAKKAGYALHVTYAFRSLKWQIDRMCHHFANGWEAPCGKNPKGGKNTGLSCPGPNVHTDGYAIDVHLTTADGKKTLTGAGGGMQKCPARRAEVKKSAKWMALHKIMGEADWWWYCGEPWHFEYTVEPVNKQRERPVGHAKASPEQQEHRDQEQD